MLYLAELGGDKIGKGGLDFSTLETLWISAGVGRFPPPQGPLSFHAVRCSE